MSETDTKHLKKNSKLRFAISGRDPNKISSAVWSCFRNGDDIYIAPSSSSGTIKISLHASGICRYALTSQLASHNPPLPSSDRVISKWKRGSCAGVQHSHALSIKIATTSDWPEYEKINNKKVTFLPRAPSNYCTEIAIFYSESDPLLWSSHRWPTKNILGRWQLSDETFVTFRRRVVELDFSIIQDAMQNAKGIVAIGYENPEIATSGPDWVVFTTSTNNFGTIYSVFNAATLMPGIKPIWHTRTGHKFK